MLLEFVVEPEAFGAGSDRETVEWRELLNRFLSFWNTHGVLLMPHNFDPETSGLNGQRLNDFKSLILQGSTKKFRRRTITSDQFPDWNKVQSWDDLKQYEDKFELAFLEQVRAFYLGLDDNLPCVHEDMQSPQPIEIGRWNLIDPICGVKRLINFGKMPVLPKDSPAQIWNERFHRYSIHSDTVVAVDLYAVRERNQESLLTFLTSVLTNGWQSIANYQHIKLFSTYDNPDHSNFKSVDSFENTEARLNSLMEDLSQVVGTPKILIDIFLLPDKQNLRSHKRWIRFNYNYIELENGLEIFKAARHYSHSFQLKDADNDDKEVWEKDAVRYCESRAQGDDGLVRIFTLKPKFQYLKRDRVSPK